MLEGGLVDEAIAMRCELAGHLGWSTGAWSIPQALRSLTGAALSPCAAGRIGTVEQRGDSIAVVARDDRTDRLRAAKDPGFFRLLEPRV